jgi:hypothetical protein
LLEPAPGFHVLRAECWAHDALALRTDAAKVAKVGKQAPGVDARHMAVFYGNDVRDPREGMNRRGLVIRISVL